MFHMGKPDRCIDFYTTGNVAVTKADIVLGGLSKKYNVFQEQRGVGRGLGRGRGVINCMIQVHRSWGCLTSRHSKDRTMGLLNSSLKSSLLKQK